MVPAAITAALSAAAAARSRAEEGAAIVRGGKDSSDADADWRGLTEDLLPRDGDPTALSVDPASAARFLRES